MSFIRRITDAPYSVFVVVILGVLAGIVSFKSMPFELKPSVDKPEIGIRVSYPGAASAEVEEAIVRPIEEELKEVNGLVTLTSTSSEGSARVNMEFDWGVDVDDRLVDVINKLSNVKDLPEEAGSPSVEVESSVSDERIFWMVAQADGSKSGVSPDYIRRHIDEWIQPRFTRIPGVGSIQVNGGSEREIHVDVDLDALARRGLTVADVVQALRVENRNVRGGPLNLGKRRYLVRTVGRADSFQDLRELVLQRTQNNVTLLRDVASIQAGVQLKDSVFRYSGKEAVGLGLGRRLNANVPEVAEKVDKELVQINKDLKTLKVGFQITQVYTDMTYINSSLEMVNGSMMQGAILTVLILLIFLRSPRSVLVVAISIPLSVISSFLLLDSLGRTLNVISLAGIAFAIGMTVDNAVVVLEMIFKRLEQGAKLKDAAVEGAELVVMSLLGGTLTTVAVFVPVLLIQGEVGQLLRDLALAIMCSVSVSLITSVAVIPTLARGIMKKVKPPPPEHEFPHQTRFGRFIYSIVRPGPKSAVLKLSVVGVAVGLSYLGWMIKPAINYLPEGNRNLIFLRLGPSPGANHQHLIELVSPIEQELLKDERVAGFFTSLSPGRFTAIGVRLKEEYANAKHLNDFVNKLRGMAKEQVGWQFVSPGRSSIFRMPSRNFQIHLAGSDLNKMVEEMNLLTLEMDKDPMLDGVRPNYQLGAPEMKVVLKRPRLRELGMTGEDVSSVVEASLGGRVASRFVDGNREYRVMVRAQGGAINKAQDLENLKLYSRSGKVVFLRDVADIEESRSSVAINHRDLERSVSLNVGIAPDAKMSTALDHIENTYLTPMRERLGTGYNIQTGGAADGLGETLRQLVGSTDPLAIGTLPVAIMIVYLIMVALFQSFKYPLVVMITVPLSMTGAFFGVAAADARQKAISGSEMGFDMITMFGLIILVGIVVNSAILLVDRTNQWRANGLDIYESLAASAADRLRPIAMTSISTIFGMLPLALGQGAGAEMYQGLGAALVGGLAVSTLLTPVVVPTLMAVVDGLTGVGKVKKDDEDEAIGQSAVPLSPVFNRENPEGVPGHV